MPTPVVPYPYYPPKSLTKTQTQIVRELDPEWRPAMVGEDTEFVFSNGRTFKQRPSQRGPYED
jgi:hypothetical protein